MFDQLKNILLKTEEGKFKLNQKASIFLFCLLLSTFFWFLSVLGKNYTTTLKFYIDYTDFSNDFILTERPVDFIEGEVFGSGYELLGEQLSLSRSRVKLSLKSAKSTDIKNKYFIDTRQLRDQLRTALDRDLQLNTIVQDSIVFLTQKRLSKVVNIKPNLDLEFASGYALRGDISFEPSSIKISGPKTFIDTISTIYTEKKTINSIEDSLEVTLSLNYPKEVNGINVSQNTVKVSIPAEKHTEKRIDLKIELSGNKNFSIKTFPEEVTAILLVPLSLYGQLTKSNIRATAVFDENDNSNKLKVNLKGIPKYSKLIRVEPQEVEYIIRK